MSTTTLVSFGIFNALAWSMFCRWNLLQASFFTYVFHLVSSVTKKKNSSSAEFIFSVCHLISYGIKNLKSSNAIGIAYDHHRTHFSLYLGLDDKFLNFSMEYLPIFSHLPIYCSNRKSFIFKIQLEYLLITLHKI